MSYFVNDVILSPAENLVIRDDLTSSTASNYVGDETVGSNWTNKIMAVKSSIGDQAAAQEKSEIADEEWVCSASCNVLSVKHVCNSCSSFLIEKQVTGSWMKDRAKESI